MFLGSRGTCEHQHMPKLQVLQEPSPFSPLPKTPNIIWGHYLRQLGLQILLNSSSMTSRAVLGLQPFSSSRDRAQPHHLYQEQPRVSPAPSLPPSSIRGISPVPAPAQPHAPSPAKAGTVLPRPPNNASPVPKPWAGSVLARREHRAAAPAEGSHGGHILCFETSLCKFWGAAWVGPELVLAVEMAPAPWQGIVQRAGSPTPCPP